MRQAGLDMTDERATRAVKTFRKMQSQLTAYARAITKNPKVRVVMSSQSAHTDGVNIFYRPPIALGDNLKHERGLCDKRDNETKLQLCPACAVGERVRVSIYHEIGHIAGQSFAEVSEEGKAEALRVAMRERGKPLVFTRNESFVYLANSINPYLGLLFNAVEDARVDLRMVTQRKGIKVMMEASTNQIFRDGVERPGQDNLPWSEQPLNAQVAVACMLRVIGYTGWEGQLHPDVVRHSGMVNVQAVIDKLRNSQSAADTFGLTYPLMEALREYGYFKKPEEIPTLDNPPPEPETSDSDTNPGDDEDKSDESEGESKEDQSESDQPDEREDTEGDADSSSADESDADDSGHEADGEATDEPDESMEDDASADQDGSPEGAGSDDSEEASDDAGSDESGEVDDQDADGSGGDREADDQEESSGDGSSSGPSDGDPASDGSDEADGGDDSQAADDTDADESGESGGSEAGGDSASSDGTGDDSADDDGDSAGPGGHHSEGESSDASADGDGESREEVGDPEGGTGGAAGPGEDTDQGGADSGQGEDGSASGEEDRDGDGHQGEGEVDADLQGRDAGDPWAEPDEDPEGSRSDPDGSDGDGSDGTGDDQRGRLPDVQEVPEEVPDDGGEDPAAESGDTGVDEGAGGEAVPDHQHGATGDPCGCSTCGSYGTPSEVSEAVEDAHARVGQLDGDETGAEDDQLTIMIAQGNHFDTSSTEILGVREITEGEPYFVSTRNEDVIPEEYIAPALLQTRRAFTDNLKASVTRNLKTGRVSSTALGRRAWNNDPRLFDKRKVPGKKSYSVLIGIDLSSSTNGSKSNWIRKAALAQAELCARAGIRFAIYGHSGNSVSLNPDDPYDYDAGWAMMMDIIVVKTFDQPWDDEARGRMQSVKSNGGNVDGHTFEYYRKRLDEEVTTDRVLMYYTDGAMPAANYDEELEILTRELKRMARSGYITLGVGVKTDSPKEHGLDTYRLDSLSDVKGVVMYLEKVIGKRG